MARKSSPDSDPAAWIEDLPDDELRRLLSLGSARLRARLTSTAGHLVLKNIGEVGVTIEERGANPHTLAPSKSESLAPQQFSTTTGDASGASSRWLSPRARTVLVFQLTADTAGAEVALDLTGWRADAARIGAPEVLLLSSVADGKDGAGAHASYLPVVTLSLDKSAPVEVIVIGRGPEDDPGRLLRGLFEPPVERSGGEDEVVDDDEPRPAPTRGRTASKRARAAPKKGRAAPKKAAEK